MRTCHALVRRVCLPPYCPPGLKEPLGCADCDDLAPAAAPPPPAPPPPPRLSCVHPGQLEGQKEPTRRPARRMYRMMPSPACRHVAQQAKAPGPLLIGMQHATRYTGSHHAAQAIHDWKAARQVRRAGCSPGCKRGPPRARHLGCSPAATTPAETHTWHVQSCVQLCTILYLSMANPAW